MQYFPREVEFQKQRWETLRQEADRDRMLNTVLIESAHAPYHVRLCGWLGARLVEIGEHLRHVADARGLYASRFSEDHTKHAGLFRPH